MAQSVIVDEHGRPISKAGLLQEVVQASTTGVFQAWSTAAVSSSLDPARLRSIMTAAASGDMVDYLTLAEEMEEKDPHYAAVLGTRKRAVSGLPVTVEAASKDARDEELAEVVRGLTEAPEFGDMMDDLLDAIGKGFSVVEPIWQLIDGKFQPKAYEYRDPRWFQFDKVTGKRLQLRSEGAEGAELPPGRLVVHQPRLKSGLPIRGGVARLVAVSYMCKAFSLKDWMRYAELFGMPLRIGRYGPGAKPDDIAVLRRAVSQLAADAAAILPDGMKIEFEEIANAAGGAELFERLAEWLDKQISKAVLGQTMTTDDGSSQSQANVHNEVRMDILRADAKQLAATLNRLVRIYIDLNYGPQQHYPRIVLQVTEPEDLKALADALTPFIDRGLRVEESAILDKFGLAAAEASAIVLRPANSQPAPALNSERQHCACPACGSQRKALNSEQYRDGLDALAEEALGDWRPLMQPVVAPVHRLAESSASFEEFRAGLAGLLDEMDSSALVEQLAHAAFRARGQGDGGDQL
jgi:phage gp29-like protein